MINFIIFLSVLVGYKDILDLYVWSSAKELGEPSTMTKQDWSML